MFHFCRPKNSSITECLRALPPTCKLVIMNNAWKIVFQEMGTSDKAYISIAPSMPSSSTQQTQSEKFINAKKNHQISPFSPKFLQRFTVLKAKGQNSRFTFEELNRATESFCTVMLIGEGAHSQVYRAVLENGQAAAVKVLKTSSYSEEIFCREVEILSVLKHENVVQLLGYCYCKEMYAIVYNLLNSNLKQRLNQLKWIGRVQIALGLAKALEYLHSRSPPIIHKDVNSSNILLSEDGKPQARPLLTCGLEERLIDPDLKEDYNEDEMKAMMIVARLCLLHSSSRRPTMKTILQFLEEPNYVLEMQKKREDLVCQSGNKDESDFSVDANSVPADILLVDEA